jgi:hypothetical protein
MISSNDGVYCCFVGCNDAVRHDHVHHGMKNSIKGSYQLRNMSSAGDRTGNTGPDIHYPHSPVALL